MKCVSEYFVTKQRKTRAYTEHVRRKEKVAYQKTRAEFIENGKKIHKHEN